MPPLARRPGQDVPPRDLRRHPRPARRRRTSSTSSASRASARSTSSSSTSPRSRRPSAPARRHRRGDRDDRRRRRGAPRRGRPQRGRRRRGRRARSTTPSSSPSSRSAATSSARSSGPSSPPRRSGRSPPTTPRSPRTSTRSRATTFPNRLALVLEKVDDLRYGENPHQRAAFYRETTHRSGTLADATQIRGDAPSFNNLSTSTPPTGSRRDYTAPTVAIVKHTDPVGLASADELVEAYRHALETDPVAAFGGIVGVNRELDGATAREIAANSYEAVVAPGYGHAALGILKAEGRPRAPRRPARPDRGHARLRHRQPRLQAGRGRPPRRDPRRPRPRPRPAPGRHQAPADARGADRPAVRLAGRPPRPVERDRARPERRDGRDRGGPGQPPGLGRDRAPPGRRPGEDRGHGRATPTSRSRTASRWRAQAGVTAIIQPGGSIRDEMAIEVADRHHLAMVFTGTRHFRH